MDVVAVSTYHPWAKKGLIRIAAIIAATATIAANSCDSYQVKVSGRVISYESIRLEKLKLRYAVRLINGDLTQEGLASIQSRGDFSIRIKKERDLPYYFSIEGLENIPEASITENSLTIANNRQKEINMGDVFIYNRMRAKVKTAGPVAIEDIVADWDSDIPDVDYYKIKLVGRLADSGYFGSAVSVCGIRGTKFAFSALARELREEGTRQIGDLVLVVNNAELEGIYFLDIIAIRRSGSKAREVGKSNSEIVTIVRHKKI
jgi:hypothetical protein